MWPLETLIYQVSLQGMSTDMPFKTECLHHPFLSLHRIPCADTFKSCEFEHPDRAGYYHTNFFDMYKTLAYEGNNGKKKCGVDNFVYPWFPEMWFRVTHEREDRTNMPGWPNPYDSLTRLMYRLPALDITKIQCTPSPFVNAGRDGITPRARFNSIGVPTLCNDEMTQAVVGMIGPGEYEAEAGSSYATLSLGSDGDTVTCEPYWADDVTLGIYTTHLYITVRFLCMVAC